MSHSQFHCTTRVYLHMHGLSFETSICYWQDQPGSRNPRHTRGHPAHRRALADPFFFSPFLSKRQRPPRPPHNCSLSRSPLPAFVHRLRPAGAASRTRPWRRGRDATGGGEREPGTLGGEGGTAVPARGWCLSDPGGPGSSRDAADEAARHPLTRLVPSRAHASTRFPTPRGCRDRLGLTRPRGRPLAARSRARFRQQQRKRAIPTRPAGRRPSSLSPTCHGSTRTC